MPNIYWPVFKNIERRIEELTFSIHINDDHLSVYSSLITDIILRCASEIESISKDLYRENGGKKAGNIKFDFDALEYLNEIWGVEDKTVILTNPNCFQSNRVISPFAKNELKGERAICGWNNSYQNLKHERSSSICFGSIKYLFEIMAALYVLNVYYRNETFSMGESPSGGGFDQSLGSSFFSVSVSQLKSYTVVGREKEETFGSCIYYIDLTDKTREQLLSAEKKYQKIVENYLTPMEEFQDYVRDHPEEVGKPTLIYKALGKEKHLDFIRLVTPHHPFSIVRPHHEARLNKDAPRRGE